MSVASAVCYAVETSQMSSPAPIVFIVDDDVSVRESLELLTRNEGWQVETFASAQKFLDRPRSYVPSCLVLDVSLPGLNGLELQERVASGYRRDDKWRPLSPVEITHAEQRRKNEHWHSVGSIDGESAYWIKHPTG